KCVAGRVSVIGHNKRDFLTLKPDLIGRQYGLDVIGQRGHPGEILFGHVGAGDHGSNLGMGLSYRYVDAGDSGVRHRGPEYCHMKHAGQLDVVNVVAHASDQARILFAKHPAMTHRLFIIICEADGRFCGDTHTGLLESSTSAVAGVSCAAAHWMLLTMVSYPVHRQIWPEIASRMVSALGSGSRSKIGRASRREG